jgi:dTDP-4-dehydrorhamnose reductase
MTSVAEAHARPDDAHRINVEATRTLAQAARSVGARFVFSSTDMVFDGEAAPYRETDTPRPVSHYGRTKAEAEWVAADFDDTLVVRLPLMYGFARGPRDTTFAQQVAALGEGRPLRLFTDEFRTPIWLADAAVALIALGRSDQTGIIHVAGPKRLSRYEMVEQCARLLDIRDPQLVPTSRLSIDAHEPRPADLSLDGTRFVSLFPNLAPGPVRAEVFGAAMR